MTILHTAFVLAAGLGMRMRPLTNDLPKPLLKVGGSTMLDQVLERLEEAGVKKVVVNAHYKKELIKQHLAARPQSQLDIHISEEDTLLDTGGGVKKALPLLGDAPIFVINADLPWRDGEVPALQDLAQNFDARRMDALLLLMPLEKARGFKGAGGDFFMGADGRLTRKNTNPPRPFVFISAQIIKPALYAHVQEDAFSNNLLWNHAEERGRLYGLAHKGSCFHVGTPEDFEEANRLLATGKGW